MGEWSLVLFTILMQAAIGSYLWVTIIKTRNQQRQFAVTDITVAVISTVAIVISLLHLGTPTGAMRSLLNIGDSWLSREILFSGGFFGLAILTVVLARFKVSGAQELTVRWLTSIVGIFAVLCMSKLYMSSVIPAWMSGTTMIDFFATMIILGGILTLVTGMQEAEGEAVLISIVMVAAAVLHAVVYPSFVADLGAGTAAAQASVTALAETYGTLMVMRWALVLVGVGLVVLSQYVKIQRSTYMYVALGALLIGQVAGRYIFFAVGVAKGIGMI